MTGTESTLDTVVKCRGKRKPRRIGRGATYPPYHPEGLPILCTCDDTPLCIEPNEVIPLLQKRLTSCLYSPDYREVVFSATGLPVYGVLGNPA